MSCSTMDGTSIGAEPSIVSLAGWAYAGEAPNHTIAITRDTTARMYVPRLASHLEANAMGFISPSLSDRSTPVSCDYDAAALGGD